MASIFSYSSELPESGIEAERRFTINNKTYGFELQEGLTREDVLSLRMLCDEILFIHWADAEVEFVGEEDEDKEHDWNLTMKKLMSVCKNTGAGMAMDSLETGTYKLLAFVKHKAYKPDASEFKEVF